GKFHTKDWYLAYFIGIASEDAREKCEKALHNSHRLLWERIWPQLHAELCSGEYSPFPAEMFSARRSNLDAQFPDLEIIVPHLPLSFLCGKPPENRLVSDTGRVEVIHPLDVYEQFVPQTTMCRPQPLSALQA
ncbi:MAG: hypothetical protein MK010_02345, partial [Erythrobacter sp.]|nr:hypothetical protein [Erythrobacter sp.]